MDNMITGSVVGSASSSTQSNTPTHSLQPIGFRNGKQTYRLTPLDMPVYVGNSGCGTGNCLYRVGNQYGCAPCGSTPSGIIEAIKNQSFQFNPTPNAASTSSSDEIGKISDLALNGFNAEGEFLNQPSDVLIKPSGVETLNKNVNNNTSYFGIISLIVVVVIVTLLIVKRK
ncbi:MAG: hypothetical protein IT243_06030 [Bacteroidia bacterium]|nr:hypothetical protein [Bacteroidia bacterium]